MLKNLERGLNMGGWISQYKDESSWDDYLCEEDFKKVASFGFDHVRVPFDYPCVYQHGMKYLDQADEWTRNNKLGLVLDLHRAEGYFFGHLEKNRLFEEKALQDAFVNLWVKIAEHFKGQREDDMVFELLNEIVEHEPERWNALLTRTIAAIRAIDKDRQIIIGGRDYNSVEYMHELPDYSNDPKIIYTFHFYLPFPFTHQKASWNEYTKKLAQVIAYPTEELSAYQAYSEASHSGMGRYDGYSRIGIEWLENAMRPALAFQAKHPNNGIYLGEFGAIEYADMQSRINYVRDVGVLCQKFGFGRAMWAYTMGFAIVDGQRRVLSDELIKAAAE